MAVGVYHIFLSEPVNMVIWFSSFECDGVDPWVWGLAWLDSESELVPDFWKGVYKMAVISLERVM